MSRDNDDALESLGIKQESRTRRYAKRIVVLALLGGAIAAAYQYYKPGARDPAVRYTTDQARIEDILVTVSATGNLEPKDKVEVSSELSGRVEEVLVDFNDRVDSGEVLARLDTTKLEADVLVKRNTLISSRAAVSQAKAALREKQVSLDRIRQLFELSGGRTPSRLDVDAAEVALIKAEADLTGAEAAVAVAAANLEASETDLAKARIVSPIDGVVLSRQVEPGQTVAASLSAPTLFVLARDLVEMELHVDIDEADIGRVKPGQHAFFTVDAFPQRRFEAHINQIRLMSATTESSSSSVVSYETVLAVRNDDLALLPGMTAIAEISVAEARDELTIANAALRYDPAAAADAAAQTSSGRSLLSFMMPRRTPSGRNQRGNAGNGRAVEGSSATVWVLDEGRPRPLTVVLGLSDGLRTAIKSGELRAGDAVITDSIVSPR